MCQNSKTSHPRNRYQGVYDFEVLAKISPAFSKFLKVNRFGQLSIDFSQPLAVKALNQALLKYYYQLDWDLPKQFLCPPIPSRADYIHHLADLLSLSNAGIIPTGKAVKILDIGVGANCIYPLLGYKEYGWTFVGSEINPEALAQANKIIQLNQLTTSISLRLQKNAVHIFDGIIEDGETPFAASICNPPFHASLEEATAGNRRKQKNLKIKNSSLNFGGQKQELYCAGGEVAFIQKMIKESHKAPCLWFTTLVSKENHLAAIYHALKKAHVSDIKTISLLQGQKKARIVAWTFKSL